MSAFYWSNNPLSKRKIIPAFQFTDLEKKWEPYYQKEVIKDNITNALKPKGFAVVEFFGPKHPWCSKTQCHAKEQVSSFFQGYSEVDIQESSEHQTLAGGKETSPWHEIIVTARK